MTSGFRFARAVYSAAVNPAGPDPMMMTFFMTVVQLPAPFSCQLETG